MKKLVVFTMCSLLTVLASQSLTAQTLSDCARTELQDPARIVYQCAGGITLEAEAATALGITERTADERPTDAELSSDGLYVEVTPGSGPFQIRTPHAIAAVRGTVYVVDVTTTMTAVFVRRGEVSVSHAGSSEEVVLTPGLGVDVVPGEPLVTRRWPAERVENLLQRFGR
ncbi:FecR domain-containing protein [Roseibium sp.]|uniref:FecR domain-containing protein n=1 Tax=Roseibium sp. TaxID=1936156 RepID=UPI00326394FA